MAPTLKVLTDRRPKVVGSLGSRDDLTATHAAAIRDCCDLAEIRLDLLPALTDRLEPLPWRHLQDFPLLFTARRQDQGGARAMNATARMNGLLLALDHAAGVDIEVASIDEMSTILDELARRNIPWVASFHDFNQLPATTLLAAAAQRARAAGASVFKAAAMLHTPADLARLAEFQLADHGLPVATMGMGPLAAVSRLLCAQCGSVLNYGYLGQTPTAPGQWDASSLNQAISRLVPFSGAT